MSPARRTAKEVLFDKTTIPDDASLEALLGKTRWDLWTAMVNELRKRELHVEMHWLNDTVGWTPKWNIGDYPICGVFLPITERPLMADVSFGGTLVDTLEREWNKIDGFIARGMSSSARALLRAAKPDGKLRMRFVELNIVASADVKVLLSLVDGKLRALAAEGMRPVPRPDVIKRRATRKKSETAPMLVIRDPELMKTHGPIHLLLDTAELFIGRDPDQVDIRLDQDGVSRRHASLVRLPDGSFEVIDLGSKNGVLMNDKRIDRRVLKDGDEFTVGVTRFTFAGAYTLPDYAAKRG